VPWVSWYEPNVPGRQKQTSQLLPRRMSVAGGSGPARHVCRRSTPTATRRIRRRRRRGGRRQRPVRGSRGTDGAGAGETRSSSASSSRRLPDALCRKPAGGNVNVNGLLVAGWSGSASTPPRARRRPATPRSASGRAMDASRTTPRGAGHRSVGRKVGRQNRASTASPTSSLSRCQGRPRRVLPTVAYRGHWATARPGRPTCSTPPAPTCSAPAQPAPPRSAPAR
jgi:hypothetical protein